MSSLTRAKNPTIENAAKSIVDLIDKFKNLGLSEIGKAEMNTLVLKRLSRYWLETEERRSLTTIDKGDLR